MLPSKLPGTRTAGAHGFAHAISIQTLPTIASSNVVPSAEAGGGSQTCSRELKEHHTVKLLPRPQYGLKTPAYSSSIGEGRKKAKGKKVGKQQSSSRTSFQQPRHQQVPTQKDGPHQSGTLDPSRHQHKDKVDRRPGHKQSQHRQQSETGLKQPPRQQHIMQKKQPQQTGQQLVQPAQQSSTAAKAAAVTAVAAATLEQTRQLLATANLTDDRSSTGKTPDTTASRTSQGTSSGSRSNNNNADHRLASIRYNLPPHAYQEYRAAGVVLYDYGSPGCAGSDTAEVKVLLVRELGQVWCLPAGKLNKALDSPLCPETTAARELEEETHGLIPAAVSQAVLAKCPQMYWKDGKMVLYFMRCREGQQLPQMAAARIAAGRGHKAAAKIDQLAWIPLKSIMSGRGSRGLEKSIKARYHAEAATTAEAAAVEAEMTAALAAAAAGPMQLEGLSVHTVPAPPAILPANASAHQQQQQQQPIGQAAEQATATGVSAPHQQQLSDHSQDQTQGQQQQEAHVGPLLLRPALVINKHSIHKWLGLLVTGQTPTPGLQVQRPQRDRQLQEQEPATDLLQDPVIQALPPAPAAQAAETVSSPSSSAAQPNISSGIASVSGSLSGSSASASVLDAAAAVSAATAAALRAAGVSGGGSGAPSTGLVGHQPWALSVWSGRHEKEVAKSERKEPESSIEQEDESLALV